jgi:glycosyltransferase XagB
LLVVLPAAFPIWIVVLPTMPPPDEVTNTPDEREPVYNFIAPLRGETRSAIERLNYPREKLDVIVAVEAEDHSTRAATTARKHRRDVRYGPIADMAACYS